MGLLSLGPPPKVAYTETSGKDANIFDPKLVVYSCTYWNTEKEIIEYKIIFTDHVTKMVDVYEGFRENYDNREQYQIEIVEKKKICEENTPHGISKCDPLFSLFADSNRN